MATHSLSEDVEEPWKEAGNLKKTLLAVESDAIRFVDNGCISKAPRYQYMPPSPIFRQPKELFVELKGQTSVFAQDFLFNSIKTVKNRIPEHKWKYELTNYFMIEPVTKK